MYLSDVCVVWFVFVRRGSGDVLKFVLFVQYVLFCYWFGLIDEFVFASISFNVS